MTKRRKLEGKARYGPAPSERIEEYDGVLLVDKPAGPTSHDVVAMVRRRFGLRKVGHGGTLDPQATGLLILLLGKGTKLSSLFIGSDKTYIGSMRLGVSTDTQDATGRILSEKDAGEVSREQVESEMVKLTGDTMQIPPMVSAIKVNGTPLYKKARRGEIVERKPRLIHVYEFSITDFGGGRVDFIVRCTKGTYVRTLCADVGEALGCGAHMERLRKIQSGKLSVDDSIKLDKLLDMESDEMFRRIIPVTEFSFYGVEE